MHILISFMVILLPFTLKAQECLTLADSPISFVSESQKAVDQLLRNQEQPSCDVESLLNCDLFEDSQEPYLDIGGGKSIPNLTVNGAPIESSQVTPEELLSTERTFEEVRTLLLEEITKGTKPEELSPYSKILYDKINKIKFSGLQECRSSRPNGTFSPDGHSLTLCPGYLKMPKTNLVRILAHEMSHSIDHCHMMGGFYHQHDPDSYMSVSPKFQRLNLPQEKLEADILNGTLKEISAPQSPGNHPLLSQFNCLEMNKGNANSVPAHDECSYGKTTAGEDTADLWAVKIVGKYLENNPFSGEMEKQAFMFENIKTLCAPKVKSPKANMSAGFGVHSSDKVRMNDIFLAHPSVQKAMNCRPKENSCEVR